MKTLFRILKQVLVGLLVLAAIGLVALYFTQDFFLYPGRGILRGDTPEWRGRLESFAVKGFQVVEVDGPGGAKVKGFWAEAPSVGPAILWFHARDENITDINQVLTPLKELGYPLFVMEYRGYGDAPGATREADLLADAEAVFEHLCTREGVAPRRVFAGGSELGANLALRLAARKGVIGVVAVSPIPDMATAVAERIPVVPVGFLFRDRWDLDPVLPQVAAPVLIVHGTDDKVVPMHVAEDIATGMTGTRVTFHWVNDAGHRDVLEKSGKSAWDAIDVFLARPGR